MNAFDYALGLISILVSLALADIVISFHRLMRRARSIHWDGRVLVAAALVVLEIIRLWFAQWTLRDSADALTFSVYLGLFVQVMLLVLLAAAALPDEPDERFDLGTFYDANRRYFWGVFAAYQLTYFLLWLFVFGGTQASNKAAAGPIDWLRLLVPLGLYLMLAIVRRRWLDYAVPLLIIGFYLARYWNQTLAA